MEIIGAAALIAVGIVLAAVVYGRMHGARTATATATAGHPTASAPVVKLVDARAPNPAPNHDAEVLERTAAVARREEALSRKETEIDKERAELVRARQELERALEQVSGLSAGRAKQLLLKEVEEQTKHDAARRIRQIEEETKRPAPGAEHSVGVHAAPRRGSRRRDDRIRGAAIGRRHEGSDHRTRGS